MSLAALKARLADYVNLQRASSVLAWDQRTKMPPGGIEPRANQLATLSKLSHEMLVADETGTLLESAQTEVNGADYDSDDASLVRVAKRNYEKAIRVPAEHVAAFNRLTSIANEAWIKARAESDFSQFLPQLEQIFEMVGKTAEYLGYEDDIYDPLLDQFESGMKTAEVSRIFDDLRRDLVPIVEAISERQDAVSDAMLYQSFDVAKQREFGEKVVAAFGYDFQRGRQDETTHPFCINFGRDDVRITTRFNPDWLSPALFGTMHEAGHGMYEQGIGQNIDSNILGGGTSLGIHESQSRLWENIVGRSWGFWQHYYPELQATFPDQLQDVSAEDFYRAVNRSAPTFIRVEADEVTYSLHIMLRFDLERAVLNGDLAIKDLPDAWNDKMQSYLGITPPDDAHGVLQDIHWSMGIMGYFPTYALGNLLSVQFYDQAVKDHPSIPQEIQAGQFNTLLTWMRENIHVHGRKYQPAELVKRVTGGAIDAKPFIAYISRKYSDLYEF